MARTDTVDPQQLRRNAILAQLPDEELSGIRQRAEVVEAEIRRRVYEPGEAISAVYFPLSSVFSMVAHTDGGEFVVEVGTIGHEGMVGLPLFLGSTGSPHSAFCQVPGEAARLGAAGFREVLRTDGALHHLLNRFSQATMVQIAQNVVCNNVHSVEQRACRWLLTTRDRVGRETFPLTQEFLAQMLGVRRPTVSETASELQERGYITYHRGMLTVVDTEALRRSACDCYRIVRAEFDDLIGNGDQPL